jgi:dCTP diphosphatase
VAEGVDGVIRELIQEIVRFRDARDWEQFHTPRNLAMALAVEAGELLERFLWTTDQDDPDAERSREEIADVLIYALLFCHAQGIDPAEAVREKLAINEEKYPVELSRGKSAKWDEL